MKEEEWLTGSDAYPMLEHLRMNKVNRTKAGRRKLRLFACYCSYRVLRLMSDRGRQWLAFGEQYAEGLLDMEQRRQINVEDQIGEDQQSVNLANSAAALTLDSNVFFLAIACASTARLAISNRGDHIQAYIAEEQEQIQILRDLFGNPFRPVNLKPSWLKWNGGTVVKLAKGINANRAFDHLPVLADALEDAGCDHVDVLSHCRQGGRHLRGCWVLDMLLRI